MHSAPDNDLPLFKRVLRPGIDNLFFVALLAPLGATMPVAEAQGRWIASGTFYNYFPGKQSVFAAVIDESAQALRRRLSVVRAGASDLEAFIGDAYRAVFAFLVEDRVVFELMKRSAGPNQSLFSDPIQGAEVRELLEDLDAAIARGDAPPLDADYLAQAGSSARLTCPFGPVRSQPTRGLRGWP